MANDEITGIGTDQGNVVDPDKKRSVSGPITNMERIRPKILYFGTPVVLVSTVDNDGNVDLSPMSSAWALGNTVVLGLSTLGKTLENLRYTKECTLNFPDGGMWRNVEKLAPLTGKNPVPQEKSRVFRYEAHKFSASGLTSIRSEYVTPPKVMECQLQMECLVTNIYEMRNGHDNFAAIVELDVKAVYAHKDIILDETHVDPSAWKPLIYLFRHYFALGMGLGKSFRSET